MESIWARSSLFAKDMIICVKNGTYKKLLELINEFSKVAGYKTKIQKCVFLYTSNNQKFKLKIQYRLQWHQNI